MSIKVLHLLNGEFMSGVERVVGLLVENHRDVTPHVVCLMSGQMRAEWTSGVPIDLIAMRHKLDMSTPVRVAAYVKERRIDLINAHTLRANLVAAAVGRLTGVPVLATIHSPSARETTRRVGNWSNNRLERALRRWTDSYITVSQALGREMRRMGVRSSKITVVQNGVDPQHCTGGDGGRFRKRHGLSEDQPVAGLVALLRPRKGVEVFLRAVQEVARLSPRARFAIVGDAVNEKYGRSLRSLCGSLGIANRVRFIPFTREVRDVLAAIDLLVLPSLFGEGLPLVVLEAMAASLPVIVTSVDGVDEVVRDGVNGRVVAPGDERAMARALCELMTDPLKRDRWGARGRKMIDDELNACRMTRRVEEAYRLVIMRRS